MKIGIIITGIISDYFLDDLIKCYTDCQYTKIISTWNYIDKYIINKLKDNGFEVVQSDFPENLIFSSVNYQNFSCKIGIEYAETLNITHVLRVRADMYCSNIIRLIEIYRNIYEESKMIFLMHFHNNPTGYLIDYAHFGNIVNSKNYCCCFQQNYDYRFPEQFRQESCFGTSNIEEISKKVIYSGKILMDEGIDFHYLKFEYIYYQNLIKSYFDYNNSIGVESF